MSVLRVDGLLADWSPIGVTDFASCLVSFSCGRDCLLGKTLQHRFLNITAFPERHQSARRFPSFHEMVANGFTTESRRPQWLLRYQVHVQNAKPEFFGRSGDQAQNSGSTEYPRRTIVLRPRRNHAVAATVPAVGRSTQRTQSVTYAALRQKNWRKRAIRISTRANVQTIVAPVGRSIFSDK